MLGGIELKLVSWNVNGLRACVQKGFLDYFNEVNADIFCLQETKLQEGQIDLAARWVSSILELCIEKRLFWNRCVYKSKATFSEIWRRGSRYGR